jgi:hypothetical protein
MHTVIRGNNDRDEVVREAEPALSRATLVGRVSHVIAAESERRA